VNFKLTKEKLNYEQRLAFSNDNRRSKSSTPEQPRPSEHTNTHSQAKRNQTEKNKQKKMLNALWERTSALLASTSNQRSCILTLLSKLVEQTSHGISLFFSPT
jgi:hypothetical protein